MKELISIGKIVQTLIKVVYDQGTIQGYIVISFYFLLMHSFYYYFSRMVLFLNICIIQIPLDLIQIYTIYIFLYLYTSRIFLPYQFMFTY